MTNPRQIKCPTCGRAGDWFEGEWGPFCSHRCKMVDLGKWFNEEHRISEPLQPDGFSNYDDLSNGDALDRPGER